MNARSTVRRCGTTRRDFLAGTIGAAAGLPLAWLGAHAPKWWNSTVNARRENRALGMPGRYPGQVVEVRHPGSVRSDHTIDADAVSDMVDRGMTALTGAGHAQDAWKTLFQKGDIVGIKVNPVGRAPVAADGGGRVKGAVGSVSSPELVVKIVRALKDVGIRPQDIVIFERYADEFITAGYERLMREPALSGTRWYASAAAYSNEQVDIHGFDQGRSAFSPELGKHVVGYDPDVFVHMGFAASEHDPKDDRSFRTHLSTIVTRMVDKVITIPCLKDHRSAGVTLALKNLSHGMNNNVARSHLGGFNAALGKVGPNQCNTFIPTAVAQRPLVEKSTLHILDGLIGVYEGGPGCWNRTWGTWQHKGLFFATDPVAMDHVGWRILDAKRVAMGWPVVARMGLLTHDTPEVKIGSEFVRLAGATPLGAAGLAVSVQNIQQGRASESFTLRQPEHVILAGQLGLGVFDWNQIAYRSFEIGKT